MWEHAAALAWWERAQKGEVWTPGNVQRDAALALLLAVHQLNEDIAEGIGFADKGTLVIDTIDGGRVVWEIADEIGHGEWDCAVRESALSAGLILVCACTGHRTCVPNSRFLFHGLDIRDYEASDRQRAEWFAERTKMPAEFWLAHCGEDFGFGAEEALEFGVVHEIAGDAA